MAVLLLSAIGQVIATHLASKPVMAAMLALRTFRRDIRLTCIFPIAVLLSLQQAGLQRIETSRDCPTNIDGITGVTGITDPPELALNSLLPLTVMLAFLQFGAMAQNAWT